MVDWIRQDDGSLHKSINHSLVVGLKISTKSVGRDEREDITHNYKYPEGGCFGSSLPCRGAAGFTGPACVRACVCVCV